MHDEMQPQIPAGPEHDNEGAMARADLFKLANYSVKLFKKIDDGQQLEAWVQAKITKAADYIASVYHYLEYEMEFSQYGEKLENSDVYSEDKKLELKNKLMEAKEKIKALKVKQAEKVKEDQEKLKKTGDSYKTSKGGTVTKTATGLKHEKGDYSDEERVDTQKKPSKAAKSSAEKAGDRAADKAQAKASKDYEKAHPGSVKRYVDGKLVKEGAKPDYIDLDKDGNKKEPMKKAAKDAKSTKKVAEAKKADKDYDQDGEIESGKDEYLGSKIRAAKKAGKLKEGLCSACHKDPCVCKEEKCNECGMYESKCKCATNESAKPSAGLSKAKKSAVVKKAKAGKDIGKPGKNFEKVAKAAEKSGAKDGEAVAAAAMWKNIKKESVETQPEVIAESADLVRMKELLTRLNG